MSAYSFHTWSKRWQITR